MGENCFFILKKKCEKTLKAAIIVRKNAKIRLFLTPRASTQHVHGNEREKLRRDRSYYSFQTSSKRFERKVDLDGQNAPRVDLLCDLTDRRKH